MYQDRRGLSLDAVQAFNRGVILSAVHDLGVCTRKDISVKTGLDQATVTRALAPLIESDVVEEIGFAKGPRGRRSISLSLGSRRHRIIAIRLVRLSFAVALFDLQGRIVASETVAIRPDQDAGETCGRIVDILERFRALAEGEVLGIGVALPGPFLQSDERIILMTESPQWQAFDFVPALRRRFEGIPVFASHDAKVAALAVWRGTAAAVGAKVMLYVMLGQGVGSAIVTDGKVFAGSRGLAGEIGHTSIDRHGPRCKCGNRGCLELYSSTLALLRTVHDGVREGRATSLTEGATFDDVVAAYRAHDPLATATIERVAEHLAQGLVNGINLLDPDLIVLGEEACAFGAPFLRVVVANLRRLVLPSILERITVTTFGLETDIAMHGSFLSVLEQTCLGRRAHG